MDDLAKELEDIRNRLNRVRTQLTEEGFANMVERDAARNQARDPRLDETVLGRAMASQRATADRRTYPECDVEPVDGFRLILPLHSFDEQIAGMVGRILKATDDLREHNRRVLGPQPTIGLGEVQEKIAYDRPSGALDRLTETIGALEGAVIYLEMQVSAATGLA